MLNNYWLDVVQAFTLPFRKNPASEIPQVRCLGLLCFVIRQQLSLAVMVGQIFECHQRGSWTIAVDVRSQDLDSVEGFPLGPKLVDIANCKSSVVPFIGARAGKDYLHSAACACPAETVCNATGVSYQCPRDGPAEAQLGPFG